MYWFTCGIAFGAQELEMEASARFICVILHLWARRSDSSGSDPLGSAHSKRMENERVKLSSYGVVCLRCAVHSEGGVVGVVGGLALKGRCLPPHLRTFQRLWGSLFVSRLCVLCGFHHAALAVHLGS